MQGTLDDFALPDIIQLISLSKKTGAVHIQGGEESGSGRIYFNMGKVVSAQLDELPTLEAFFSFFTFSSGTFQFVDNEAPPPGELITRSNELLIMEGIGRAEEWTRLRARIPSRDSSLELVADPAAQSRDINLKPEEWRVLTLVGSPGRDTLRTIRQRTGFTELQTARILYQLIGVGLLAVQATAPPAAPPPPAPPALPDGKDLYRRLDQAASQSLGPTGHRVLDDAYRRLRITSGADLDPVQAGNLCDQFERAASLLVGPGRARTLADTLRRTAAEFYGG